MPKQKTKEIKTKKPCKINQTNKQKIPTQTIIVSSLSVRVSQKCLLEGVYNLEVSDGPFGPCYLLC